MQTDDVPVALTIAGTDSGGGAGIQADLKTFAMHAVHGTSVVTCVTAQNTVSVTRVDALPIESVIAQWDAVTSDMNVSAVKTGMLLSTEIVEAVCESFANNPLPFLIVDPVMISRAGDKLLDDSAIESIRNKLLPLATVLTPNRFEAQLLAGMEINDVEQMKDAAKRIIDLGVNSVLIKGGGLGGVNRGIDVWWDGSEVRELKTESVETKNTHGTGCSLSAAITANCAIGMSPFDSCVAAKEYVTTGLKQSLSIGRGSGPICHYHPLTKPKQQPDTDQ